MRFNIYFKHITNLYSGKIIINSNIVLINEVVKNYFVPYNQKKEILTDNQLGKLIKTKDNKNKKIDKN